MKHLIVSHFNDGRILINNLKQNHFQSQQLLSDYKYFYYLNTFITRRQSICIKKILFERNKAEENKGRKERKKSLDLIDKKKPLYHSTPPPRMRLQSGLEQEEGKTPSSIKATPNAGQTFKKGHFCALILTC